MELLSNLNFSNYAKWSGYLTLLCFGLSILAFILKWGVRFRLVGVTSFMGVLTAGIFALGLGLLTRVEVPGAIRYALVYDSGTNQAVISLPNQVTQSEVEATLKQAAWDLFSYGRPGRELTIRARTILHPEPGLSIPVYLGEVKRSLKARDDGQIQVKVFSKALASLPKNS
jgi:hypothetical protein